jgi:hypothetical protein
VPLQIEVGKRYRTRSGDVVEITSNDGHQIYPFTGHFVGQNESIYFTGRGGEWGLPGKESEFDLIEELPADAPE